MAGPIYLCGHHARQSWRVLERTALRIRADVPNGSYFLPMPPPLTDPTTKENSPW